MGQHTVSTAARPEWHEGREIQAAWRSYVRPLLSQLSQRLDLRLVRTLRDGVEAVIRLRLRPHALWLTELGSLLLGAAQAPAGVKRLARLLAAAWSADEVEQWLLEQADGFMAAQPAGDGLVTFDQSVIEKPESVCAEGLCRVRSGKARRLARHRVGFSGGPPPRPVVVPGWHWLAATVTGWSGPALLACCRWWSPTAPGDPLVESARHQQTASQIHLLQDLARRWGVHALFVLDRGFAGRPFLQAALAEAARLVVRWPKRYRLYRLVRLGQPAKSATQAWRLTAGQRAWGTVGRWDARRRCWVQTSGLALPVRLPDGPFAEYPLWLVVSRRRRTQRRAGQAGRPTRWVGDEPWRLLTTEPVQTLADAQRIIQAYARRWQVETAFRFSKSERGVESIRVRGWERQAKLLALLSLAYSFLVWLLQTQTPEQIARLLRLGCHRTGRRVQVAAAPLYRLRAALVTLLAAALPIPIAQRYVT